MDEKSSQVFTELRERYFPANRNYLPAHISLFHHLPGELEPEIATTLQEICSRVSAFPIRISGLRNLGRGVAYNLEAPSLLRLRAELAEEFRPYLTRQDQQRFQPHVTIQNKVDPSEAQALLFQLQAQFQSFSVEGTGIICWSYLGGPWKLLDEYPFQLSGASNL